MSMTLWDDGGDAELVKAWEQQPNLIRKTATDAIHEVVAVAADPAACGDDGQDCFDREPPFLRLTLPLPPPDNHLHASAAGRRYPTKQYQEWLRYCRPILEEVLGDWEPPSARWWLVDPIFSMPSRGDAQNCLKALFDLLSGAYVVERGYTDEKGRKISKGAILHGGGLWADDNRIAGVRMLVREFRSSAPGVVLVAQDAGPWYPCDCVEAAKQERVRQRAAARAAKIPSLHRSETGGED
jgi:hypothetical protein